MKKIVYLLDSLDSVNLIKADVLLIAVKGLSTRSMFEHTLEEIKAIKANYSKEVFLLCDAVLWENDKVFLEEHIEQLLNVGDKILFSDLCFFMLAIEKGLLDKLIYYSPTLLVSLEEIKSFKKLGIDHFIISKECEYKGYKHILNNCKDVHLGMLALGYPQIYYSKRKMLNSFQKEYSVINLKCDNNYLIKEKTRDIFHPIFEDEKGTFIFAGEVFFWNMEWNILLLIQHLLMINLI